MSAPALEIDNLAVARGGRPVVHGISLDVPAGAVTALLGANGAGKSSLVLGLAGRVKPVSGEIRVNGVNVAGWRPQKIRRAGLAAVPEGREEPRASPESLHVT